MLRFLCQSLLCSEFVQVSQTQRVAHERFIGEGGGEEGGGGREGLGRYRGEELLEKSIRQSMDAPLSQNPL